MSSSLLRSLSVSVLALPWFGCVPEGPATPPTSTRAPVPSAEAARVGGAPLLGAGFSDDFERADLGPDWRALGPAWRIVGGRLCGRGARNRGVWLQRRLPVNARIEFDAVSESSEGDIKAEAWGDGASGARGASYTDATSYVAILGGWKNTKHVLARLDEHGPGRQALSLDPLSDEERERPLAAGQSYRVRVERADGKTVDVSANGTRLLRLADPSPLVGAGHEYFGFNDWEAPVCFDNLRITPL